MTFERSFDYPLLTAIAQHPRIYAESSDDYSPAREKFKLIESDAFIYVLVRDEEMVLGFFAFCPQSEVCWEIHTCLLPSARGAQALEAARGILEWAWTNSRCRRIFTNVPEFNRGALWFSRKAGLEEFGRNVKSFLRGGKLHDQILLGISRPGGMECPSLS
jgi:RimJ/RimL family protein N-acetyltransferase